MESSEPCAGYVQKGGHTSWDTNRRRALNVQQMSQLSVRKIAKEMNAKYASFPEAQ